MAMVTSQDGRNDTELEGAPDKDGAGDGPQFAWEVHLATPPKEVQYLWSKTSCGEKVDLASILSEVLLPSRPPDNSGRSSVIGKLATRAPHKSSVRTFLCRRHVHVLVLWCFLTSFVAGG